MLTSLLAFVGILALVFVIDQLAALLGLDLQWRICYTVFLFSAIAYIVFA